jgi:dynein heavy chain
MKSTKFADPFRDKVNEWETKLSFVSEILENLLQVQRKWIYLDDIFQGDDIKREMRTEVQSFSKITEKFQEILINMRLEVFVVNATHYKNPAELLEDINKLLEDLEVIQRALELYLETKRRAFPRFYFISNDDLLEVSFSFRKRTSVFQLSNHRSSVTQSDPISTKST